MVLALGLAFFFESQATTTVIIVRHADVAPGLGAELGLSAQGAFGPKSCPGCWPTWTWS